MRIVFLLGIDTGSGNPRGLTVRVRAGTGTGLNSTTRQLQNKPLNVVQIGQELHELYSKQVGVHCFDHNLLKSCPIWTFSGLF